MSQRTWSARRSLVLALLLAPLAARVPWLEVAWSAIDRCSIRGGHVREDDGAFVVMLDVTLESPVCVISFDATPPLARREEAERRLAAWPAGSTVSCHRARGLCGAGIERPHVAAPFWAIPVAWLALVAHGLARLRSPRTTARPAGGGPFRSPGEVAAPTRLPIEIRAAASGIGWRIASLSFALLGLLGAAPMAVIFWLEPLHDVGYPLVVAGMAVLMSAILVRALMGVWPRRRLVVAGDGGAAFVGTGIGPLELRRRYASFGRTPDVFVAPEHATGRHGGQYVVAWRLVLSDGAAELAMRFDEEAEAERAAEHLRAALTAE
jgi:hypothetical protein